VVVWVDDDDDGVRGRVGGVCDWMGSLGRPGYETPLMVGGGFSLSLRR